MYSKVANIFITVYNATVGEFAETDLFKSASIDDKIVMDILEGKTSHTSSLNYNELEDLLLEDRTPTLFEEHGKLINWIYGIHKWDGTNKLSKEELFITKDDKWEYKRLPKSYKYYSFIWNLCKIFPDRDMQYLDPLLKKELTVRDLYLHIRFMTGHSLIKAIEAQNKLDEITKRLEIEKNVAIELATNEALRMAVENRELHRELDIMRAQIKDLKSIIAKIASLATENYK